MLCDIMERSRYEDFLVNYFIGYLTYMYSVLIVVTKSGYAIKSGYYLITRIVLARILYIKKCTCAH